MLVSDSAPTAAIEKNALAEPKTKGEEKRTPSLPTPEENPSPEAVASAEAVGPNPRDW